MKKNKREAEQAGRNAVPYIIRNNEMAKQVQTEIARLGVNALIRNRAVRFIGGGIRFLEELNVVDSQAEKSSEIRALMNRLSAVHKDALDAITVVEESVKAAEFEKFNYEDKKRKLEEGCRGY